MDRLIRFHFHLKAKVYQNIKIMSFVGTQSYYEKFNKNTLIVTTWTEHEQVDFHCLSKNK